MRVGDGELVTLPRMLDADAPRVIASYDNADRGPPDLLDPQPSSQNADRQTASAVPFLSSGEASRGCAGVTMQGGVFGAVAPSSALLAARSIRRRR